MAQEVLEGGSANRGQVVRVGDTVRRPRTDESVVVEELLVHLEGQGYAAAPRFLGVDDEGRQVLQFIPGEVMTDPAWLLDDEENAEQLAQLAAMAHQIAWRDR